MEKFKVYLLAVFILGTLMGLLISFGNHIPQCIIAGCAFWALMLMPMLGKE